MIKVTDICPDKTIALSVDHINGLTDKERDSALACLISFHNTMALTCPLSEGRKTLGLMLDSLSCRFRFEDVSK
jgi:hypothetical protein